MRGLSPDAGRWIDRENASLDIGAADMFERKRAEDPDV